MNKLTLNKLVLKRVLIIFLIIFAIFDCNIVFASENINDYIMEEIADNTKHPYGTIPIKLGNYLNFNLFYIILFFLKNLLNLNFLIVGRYFWNKYIILKRQDLNIT